MTLKSLKIFATIAFVLPLAVLAVFRSTPAVAVSPVQDDTAGVYKAKCAMCHSPKAEKSYNPDMAKEQAGPQCSKASRRQNRRICRLRAEGHEANGNGIGRIHAGFAKTR